MSARTEATSRRPRGATRRAALVAAVTVLPLAAVACSLPEDERVTPIDPDEIPPELAEPTTTTTTLPATTTTAPPPTASTLAGDTTVASTDPPVTTEPVKVFYTLGSSSSLTSVEREIPSPVQLAFVVELLESPVALEALPNLRTSVRRGLIQVDDIVIDRGTARVPLNPLVLDPMTDTEVQRAVAQIVLTFTSFQTEDQGNIGSVVFEVDGEGYPVFVPAGGGVSEGGEPLSFPDFSELIVSTPTPTPTPTEPTTTVPATEPPTSEPTTTEA